MKSKIKNRLNLFKAIQTLKKQGKKIVFTNGCFDLLHIGHIRYLSAAKKLGDILVVGLNSDRSVRRLKGENRPLIPQSERAEILAALEMVDFVCVFNQTTPRDLIIELQPDVLVKGGDWKKEDIVGKEEVERRGGKVVVVPEISGKSTRVLIKEIARKQRFEVEI